MVSLIFGQDFGSFLRLRMVGIKSIPYEYAFLVNLSETSTLVASKGESCAKEIDPETTASAEDGNRTRADRGLISVKAAQARILFGSSSSNRTKKTGDLVVSSEFRLLITWYDRPLTPGISVLTVIGKICV